MKSNKRFADDGWAIWIDGDDRSTVYLNEWINPVGRSYVDIGIRAYGSKMAKELNVFVPFGLSKSEVLNLSDMLENEQVLRGLFNTNCVIDENKNPHTTELSYNNRRVSLIKLTEDILSVRDVAYGAVVTVEIEKISDFITCDEAYLIFRVPHKTLDDVFVENEIIHSSIERIKNTISSPVIQKKYGYSIRINEARLLPSEINEIKTLHEQRIRKVLVTISIDDEYELNDNNCYRIRKLEDELYQDYAPKDYNCKNAITYQWIEERSANMMSHYNFFFIIEHNHISKYSVLLYFIIVLITAVCGCAIYDVIKYLISLL